MTETSPQPAGGIPGDGAEHARHLIAQARAADAEYKVAAVRAEVYTFLHQYGRSTSASYQVAIDLASSLRKIVDDLGGDEFAGSTGFSPSSPVTAEAAESPLLPPAEFSRLAAMWHEWCELVQRATREAVAAERERAEAAEARLAIAVRALSDIRAVVGTSTEAYHMARDALAITGSEEEARDGC
jgi:hypothetical protein